MTYNIYATFPEANYLVATATDADHGIDFASTVMKKMGVWPNAICAMDPKEHVIRGELRTLEDLKSRKEKV